MACNSLDFLLSICIIVFFLVSKYKYMLLCLCVWRIDYIFFFKVVFHCQTFFFLVWSYIFFCMLWRELKSWSNHICLDILLLSMLWLSKQSQWDEKCPKSSDYIYTQIHEWLNSNYYLIKLWRVFFNGSF